MAMTLFRSRVASLVGGACVLSACADMPEEPETVAVVRQAIPSPCVRDLAGKGALAEGWFGIRTDGSVWMPNPMGGSSEKYNPLGNDNQRLGDIDGESLFQCVVKTNGQVHCWGPNGRGNLGRGFTSVDEPIPAPVLGLPLPATRVGLGVDSACALLTDGSVYCWGGNDHGQIGNGVAGADVLTPTQVAALGTGVDAISVGYWHACALKQQTISCWGHNLYGELGIGVFSGNPDNVPTPSAVAGTYSQLSAGGFFTCAIDGVGTLSCWGDNFWGQMGIAGDTSNRPSPTLVPTIGPVAAVDTAVHSLCAVRQDGALWCWGSEESGRLGNGGMDSVLRRPPAPVSGPLGVGGVKDLRLTEGAACAITTADRTHCFGAGAFLDGQGQTSIPVEVDFCALPTLEQVTPPLGPVMGGNVVTLSGTEFVAGTEVFFGPDPGENVVIASPTMLTVTAPNHDFGGFEDVIVTLPGGRSARILDGYEYAEAPGVSQIVPPTGSSDGGDEVTVDGSYFRAGAQVSFGGVPAANVTFVSLTELRVTTPPHPGGFVDVTVQNVDGQAGVIPMGYRYVSGIVLSSVEPASGPATTRVTLTGDGFDFSTRVTFDGEPGESLVFDNEQSISVRTPAHAPGPVDVVVTRDDGKSYTLPAGFTYVPGSGSGTGAGASGANGSTGAGGSDQADDGPGDDCYCRAGAAATRDQWRWILLVGLIGACDIRRRSRRLLG